MNEQSYTQFSTFLNFLDKKQLAYMRKQSSRANQRQRFYRAWRIQRQHP